MPPYSIPCTRWSQLDEWPRPSHRRRPRESLNHMIVLRDGHRKQILASFLEYDHGGRLHFSLHRNSPIPRRAESPSAGSCWRSCTGRCRLPKGCARRSYRTEMRRNIADAVERRRRGRRTPRSPASAKTRRRSRPADEGSACPRSGRGNRSPPWPCRHAHPSTGAILINLF